MSIAPKAQSTPSQLQKDLDLGCEPGNTFEFSALNNRLAAIVDRNNSIASENRSLKSVVEDKDNQHKTEIAKIKSLYENELGEARRLLDKEADKKVTSLLTLF